MLNKKALAAAVGVPAQYQIERSLRFNSADTAYLNRTPSASNRKTWTWSSWIKRSKISTQQIIIEASDGTYYTSIYFDSDNTLALYRDFGTSQYITTTPVYRDVSAWYHIIVAVDTTQATSSNRVKMYVNGSQITAFNSAVYPAQDALYMINANCDHGIGARIYGSAVPFDGYMTEINFIDGQQLTPSSFGETDANTGIWKPKAFSGTYGTNGFYLDFSDNSGTTSTTLGKDYSGNSNNWTPNNFSVTAGTGNDSLVDTPTPYGTDTGAGGEVRGNYATLNPIMVGSTTTLSNGNLDHTSGSTRNLSRSTIGMSSGKWYFEMTCGTNPSSGNHGCGIIKTSNTTVSAGYIGSTADSYGYYGNAQKYNNGSGASYGATFTNGDVIGVAFDADNGTLAFYKNGVSQGNAYTGLTGEYYFAVEVNSTSAVVITNFGQRPFAYTAPSGYKALCTTNLPTPTIGATATTRADDYFNTVLYTGNGSTQTVSGVGFQPDLVWNKQRSSSVGSNWLNDAVRTAGYSLSSDRTDAEADFRSYFTAFNSDGFSLAGGTDGFNANAATYVAWNWKANGAGSSNTSGTITSTVSANTTAGFSIVTYTGTGANATVGHGLGVAPGMIIVKQRTSGYTYNWVVYHSANTSAPETDYLLLNTTGATVDLNTIWNDTAPTSTVFSIGTDNAVNQNTVNYVAYCFAPVAGFSAFGSYTGNGSTDGPFIYTGFRPAFIIVKQTNTGGENWYLMDNKRSTFNLVNDTLYPNQSSAETVDNANVTCDFTSNGFKIRDSYTGWNANGGTYIYACFAENPFKYSLAR